jgi:hypothetical protein
VVIELPLLFSERSRAGLIFFGSPGLHALLLL